MKQEPSAVNSPGIPWWKTATLEELHQSASLAQKVMEKAEGRVRDDGQHSPESFARAVALYTMLVDESTFETLLMLVSARLDDVADALSPAADEQTQATCGELLKTAKEGLAIVQACAELLSDAVSEPIRKAAIALAARYGTLNTACVVFEFRRGTATSVEAPSKAAFKLIRPSRDG